MLPEKLIQTTAALYRGDNFIGSGVLFLHEGALYVLTAAHNIYGKEFDQDFNAGQWQVKDYIGQWHGIELVVGEKMLSVTNDIALLKMELSESPEDFPGIHFAPIPNTSTAELFVRGYYGANPEPATKRGINYLERPNAAASKFLATIDKEQLTNSSFSHGSEWLGGLSGSGLFLADRMNIICTGILLEIPDKGDNGQLLCCSAEILTELGLQVGLLPTDIYRYNSDQFSNTWFAERLQAAIHALGKRYTPELNYELPICEVFDGISRNTAFKKRNDSYLNDILSKRNRGYSSFRSSLLTDETKQIDECLLKLKAQYISIEFSGFGNINFGSLTAINDEILRILDSCENKLYEERQKIETVKPTPRHGTPPFQNDIHEVRNLAWAVRTFSEFISNTITCAAANEPFVIINGEAGVGKSHLLGDMVSKRYEAGLKSILIPGHLLLGHENPWRQLIYDQCQLDVSVEEFLGKLNMLAHLSRERILIVIDAINEGKGREIWDGRLKSFIEKVRQYDGIGLIISIRTSYHKLLVDTSIYDDDLALRLTHYGFAEHEYDASDFFFDNYGIQKPRIPFLHPEFRNPLFLKLFCDGLAAARVTEIPLGYEGISAILSFFLDAVNKKLARALNYDAGFNIVQKAVEAFAQQLIHNKADHLSYGETGLLFAGLPEARLVPNIGLLPQYLVDEGVLAKNLFASADRKYEEGVYFQYERFLDHISAAMLIKTINSTPADAFGPEGDLHEYVKDCAICYQNSGLIEALSIQIPEKFDQEFFEIVPHLTECELISEALIKSIVWRKADSYASPRPSALDTYLKDITFEKHGLAGMFLSNIILISSVPEHPYNVLYLHQTLISQTMAYRDGRFLYWLDSNFKNDGSEVRRLLDWAWKDIKRDNIEDNSILLSTITISWFLISPNRTIRDSATKALICLLQYREHLIVQLLQHFQEVNDPYVYERLYCVAYGCTIRAEKLGFLRDLSHYVFEIIFNKGEVYPHILLRDYAKGIVEYAVKCNIVLGFDVAKAYPPYKSSAITKLPTIKEIDKLHRLKETDHKHHFYQNQILDSMTTEYGRGTSRYGDFGRYIFENALHDWNVDASGLSNYGIKRIFELGYNLDDHGEYERSRSSSSGDERLGKKYQWIVFHEILARVADNETMMDESDRKKIAPYLGAWQPGVRDIDPSMIIKETCAKDETNGCWWIPATSFKWELPESNWIALESDIPNTAGLIQITDGAGIEWLNLEMHISVSDEPQLGEEKYQSRTKNFVQQLRGFILTSDQLDRFKTWAEGKKFDYEHLPEPSHKTQVFSREYYWSEAYNYFQKPYHGGNRDEKFYSNLSGRSIAELHVPSQCILWERRRDFSIEDSISFYKPSSKLFDGLNMLFSHREGELMDKSGQIICQDPCVQAPGPSCLLVRKDALLSHLDANDLKLCWITWGEKRSIGGSFSDQPKVSHYFNGFYCLEAGDIVGGKSSIIKGI